MYQDGGGGQVERGLGQAERQRRVDGGHDHPEDGERQRTPLTAP
jgi:hypothetical protein